MPYTILYVLEHVCILHSILCIYGCPPRGPWVPSGSPWEHCLSESVGFANHSGMAYDALHSCTDPCRAEPYRAEL